MLVRIYITLTKHWSFITSTKQGTISPAIGFVFISLGAITKSFGVKSVTCVATEWLILIGYTIALCPILIKVHAINKISSYAAKFRRVQIDGKKLRLYPLYVLALVLSYLTVWTIVDMPQPVKSLKLEGVNHLENSILVAVSCSSSSMVWVVIANVWQLAILLLASILSFQSGRQNEEMNEKHLVFLVYSQFMFLLLRVIVFMLTINNQMIPSSYQSPVVSIMLSVDIIASLMIYISPKLYSCIINKERGARISYVTASLNSKKSSVVSSKKSFIGRRKLSTLAPYDALKFKDDSTKAFMKILGIDASEVEEDKSGMSSVRNLRRAGISVIKPRNEMIQWHQGDDENIKTDGKHKQS